MESALKLEIYFKPLRLASKNTTVKKERTFKSLDALAPVHEKLNHNEKYKTIHFKYLECLQDLHKRTKQKTLPGELSVTAFRNKHHVSPHLFKILVDNHLLNEFGSGRNSMSYRWNTIPPVMATVERILEDIERYEEAKKEQKVMVVMNQDHEPAPAHIPALDMDKLAKQLSYHLPSPPDLNYTLIKQYINEAVTTHVEALKEAMVANLHAVMPGVLSKLIDSIPPAPAAIVPQVHVETVYVDKIIEKTLEPVHHHYAAPATEKKGFLNKILNH